MADSDLPSDNLANIVERIRTDLGLLAAYAERCERERDYLRHKLAEITKDRGYLSGKHPPPE